LDVEKIKRKYRRNAPFYDRLIARPTDALRRAAVERLALGPGDRVLDLGCGTGLSLPLLREAVGERGVVYGVELSPDMLARARERVGAAGWRNVRLIEADAETFELPEQVQGVLCFYTHDILLSPTALPRAIALLAPDGRVVAAGAKLVPGWRGWLVNPITVAEALPAVTTRDLRRSYRPFAELEELLLDFHVEERWLGSQYLVWGRRGDP
jgi:demethylmenaquinone methyltransferase/2-methoxy-6-polyprenyl-1,4-benzoquinol methylase